jgi:hypothetical protein
METISKLDRVLPRHDVTDISEAALTTLREKFTEAISHGGAKEHVAALETLIAECAAPLEALEGGVELSLEYELFLTSLLRMHMLESARTKLEQVLVPA